MPQCHMIIERVIGEGAVVIIPPSTTEQRVTVRVEHVRNIRTPRVKLGFFADRSVKILRDELEVEPEVLQKRFGGVGPRVVSQSQ